MVLVYFHNRVALSCGNQSSNFQFYPKAALVLREVVALKPGRLPEQQSLWELAALRPQPVFRGRISLGYVPGEFHVSEAGPSSPTASTS